METTKEKFDKMIYTDFVDYQNLSDGDKACFDKLFEYLIYHGTITWSNEKLSSILGETESTLEKRLNRLEKANMIMRETSKQCFNGKWKTVDRIIKLNPLNFQFDYNTMAHMVYVNYMFMKQTEKILNRYLAMPYDEFIKAFGTVVVKYD